MNNKKGIEDSNDTNVDGRHNIVIDSNKTNKPSNCYNDTPHQDKTVTTLLTQLSMDIWSLVVEFLTPQDFCNLLVTSPGIYNKMRTNQEVVYQSFALQRGYPSETLVLSSYHDNNNDGPSFAYLLNDDNAKNGFYYYRNDPQIPNVSKWIWNETNNSNHDNDVFYIAAVTGLVWDRQQETIGIKVELFGEPDNNKITSPNNEVPSFSLDQTSFFRITTTPPFVRRLHPKCIWKDSPYNNGHSYQCAIFHIPQQYWKFPNAYYKFTFGGSRDTGGSSFKYLEPIQNYCISQLTFIHGKHSVLFHSINYKHMKEVNGVIRK